MTGSQAGVRVRHQITPSFSLWHVAPTEQPRTSQHELDTLFGFDSDAYIGENLKEYEELKEKWANSAMEERKAGGDGKY